MKTPPNQVIVAFRSEARRKGFAQTPTVVLLDKKLSDSAVRLYGLLLSYAMQTGSFLANQAAMGEDLGKTERTVRMLLKELSDRGLIQVHRQGVMLPNIYYIEDAYPLYDEEKPQPRKQTRTEKGPAENRRSQKPASDRQKVADHGGSSSPVMAAENCRHLNNSLTKKEKKEPGVSPSAGKKEEPPHAAYQGFKDSETRKQMREWMTGKGAGDG